MKIKLQNLLKHKLQWLLLLAALFGVSQDGYCWDRCMRLGVNGNYTEYTDYTDVDGKHCFTITLNTPGDIGVFYREDTGTDYSYNWDSGYLTRTNRTNWSIYTSNSNTRMNVDAPGTYKFYIWWDNGTCKMTVEYPWVVYGNFSGSWKSYNISSGTTATITDAVANSSREFKVFTDNVYSCQTSTCGTMSRSNCSNWTLYTGNSNSSINMDVSGTYTFTWSNDNNHKLSVTYPSYKLRGSWDNWSATDFTYVSSTSWTCTKSFSKTGVYNFNIRPASGSDYKGNGKYITRAHTSETLVPTSGDGNDVSITIDHTGSYSFNFNPSTGGLTVTYPTPSAPSGLYIKGPLVNNGTWTSDYRQNWSSMTYNKTSNVYTFSFNASNACNNNCSNQSLHFCVSTGENDNGKIHWAMNNTRTNWSFVNNEGSNFVASGSLVTGTSVPVVLTITYDASTYKYNMELTTACTSPTQQDVYIGSSGTTSKSLSICSDGSTSIWLDASQEGYSYQLKKQNGASWDDVGVAWSNVSSGTDGHEFSGITAAANYKIIGYPTSDGSSSSCAIDMSNSVTLSHYDDMALSDVSIDASSVCKSGTTTIRTSGANIGGTGVVNYVSSNSSIVAVSSTSTASATLTGGSTAGDATITVSVSGGCGSDPASKTATLTVNPDTDLSGATISFTPSATCNGNGTVASISDAQLGGGTGAWSKVSGTGGSAIDATTGVITGITTGTSGSHTFRYTITGGCGSDTKDGSVTLGYSPILSPVQKTVKAYEPVSFTSTNANITEWSLSTESSTNYLYDTGKRSAKFKGAPGTYTIKAAASATGLSCPGSATVIVEADDDCTPVP